MVHLSGGTVAIVCMNCVTNSDALAISTVGVVTAANELRKKIEDTLRGVTSHERRVQAWEADVAFLSSLGLDGHELLGPRPVPKETTSRVVVGSGPAFLPA
jgi:hypothetical protein